MHFGTAVLRCGSLSVSLKPPRWKDRNNLLALWLGNVSNEAKFCNRII